MAKREIITGGESATATETAMPSDAGDFASLWLDPELGDGITDTNFHSVPAGKPKDFFRTVPDPAYRRRTEIYTHKPEGVIDEQHYIIAPNMRGLITEAQPCTLVTVIYRDGSLRLWPIKLPKEGARDNEAWMSARTAAKRGLTVWTKLVWMNRAYATREALPGYAPDPDCTRLPPFDDLVKLAFGANGVIRDKQHPIYRELFGAPAANGHDSNEF
jgi:hypothetical protein